MIDRSWRAVDMNRTTAGDAWKFHIHHRMELLCPFARKLKDLF